MGAHERTLILILQFAIIYTHFENKTSKFTVSFPTNQDNFKMEVFVVQRSVACIWKFCFLEASYVKLHVLTTHLPHKLTMSAIRQNHLYELLVQIST